VQPHPGEFAETDPEALSSPAQVCTICRLLRMVAALARMRATFVDIGSCLQTDDDAWPAYDASGPTPIDFVDRVSRTRSVLICLLKIALRFLDVNLSVAASFAANSRGAGAAATGAAAAACVLAVRALSVVVKAHVALAKGVQMKQVFQQDDQITNTNSYTVQQHQHIHYMYRKPDVRRMARQAVRTERIPNTLPTMPEHTLLHNRQKSLADTAADDSK
jgi:hypothetical protein